MRAYYHPDYFLPLPKGHPFPMEKFPDAHALVEGEVDVQTPIDLTREDLIRAHCADYLDSVNFDQASDCQQGLRSYDRNRLGLPAHPNLLVRSCLETAGTVSATLAALQDGIAANLAGGTHHAFPDRGLGFCVLNDIAVTVEYLKARGKQPSQILIVDTDAHQGNANNAYFRNDLSVFTYSIHVGKNYPARKEAGDCDVPLDRYILGKDYLVALETSLPAVFAKTEPDLVFWITGADSHEGDRFGQMRLSTQDMDARNAFVLQLCQSYHANTVLVYGGGYNRAAGKTGWLHAQSVLAAANAHKSSAFAIR